MNIMRFYALLSHSGWLLAPVAAGVLLGVLAYRLERSWRAGRSTATLIALILTWGGLLVSLWLCAAGFFHFGCAANKARQAQCLSNVKQLSTAMLMYAQDHDERLPPAGDWSGLLQRYTREELVCPEAKTPISYGMNRAMSAISMNALEWPAETVLLFEASVLTGSAADCSFTRHSGGSIIGFADGHAKWTNPSTAVRWTLKD